MRSYYLDSSVALRALLGDSPSAARWLEASDTDPEVELYSSRLLQTEVTRVLRRESRPLKERDRLLVGVNLILPTEAVLRGAESIARHIRTLDAIHLASAQATGLDLIIVTHDAQMTLVAEDLGFETYDPVKHDNERRRPLN